MKYLLLVSLLFLSACQTMGGIRDDFDILLVPDETVPAAKPSITAASACPPVRIMDDLKMSIEFTDMSAPSAATEMGRLSMSDLKVNCDVAGDEMIVEMDIGFDGKLGPKARWKENDQASFAYPYFVAVTSPDGTVMSKEVFAASVSYGAKENDIRQVETIHQTMPIRSGDDVSRYAIVLGFQLSDEQLAYNRETQKP